MEQSKVTEEEVRRLIQIIKLQDLYETNEDTRNYVDVISEKLEK